MDDDIDVIQQNPRIGTVALNMTDRNACLVKTVFHLVGKRLVT